MNQTVVYPVLSPNSLSRLCRSAARAVALMEALLQKAVGPCQLLGIRSLELSGDTVGPGILAIL